MRQETWLNNRICTCRDCGKEFEWGTEGDNEKFCLKCEAQFMARVDSSYESDLEESP